jgi:hypothetical protein
MLYRLAAYVHAFFARRARRIVAALEGEGGQGTVEYVGLILLVSLLMVGMVAAMKGFNRKHFAKPESSQSLLKVTSA